MARRAGRLRKTVQIQSVSEAQNAYGEHIETWGTDATVRADITPAGSKEGIRADQVTPEVTHDVVIRYRAGTTSENRLLVRKAKTALNGAINDSVTTITVDADLGLSGSNKFRIEVGSEIMVVTAGHGTTSWTVERGADGTTAAAHSDNDEVRHLAVFNVEGLHNEGERDRYMVLKCAEVL